LGELRLAAENKITEMCQYITFLFIAICSQQRHGLPARRNAGPLLGELRLAAGMPCYGRSRTTGAIHIGIDINR